MQFAAIAVLVLLRSAGIRPAHSLSTATAPSPTKKTPPLLKSGADLSAYIRSHSNGQECSPTKVTGLDIPANFPPGTYFRNGAGRFVADDGMQVLHPFDGDGLVSALTINDAETVVFRSQFVQTKEYQEDMKIGGFSARGVFGTRKSGGFFKNAFDMQTKNVANTNVLLCGNNNERLLALWEGGAPHELDPVSLATIRQWTSAADECAASFSAHPRYDPDRNVWINFGVSDPDPSTGTTVIQLYEMDGTSGKITSRPTSLTVPGVALMHDCILTEKYIILSWNACNLDSQGGLKALLGMGPFAGALKLDESGSHRLLCIPRSVLQTGADMQFDDARIKQVEAPFSFAFHFGNAYEDEAGHIVFDRVETDDKSFDFGMSMMQDNKPLWETVAFDDIKPYKLVRYELDLETESLLDRKVLRSTGSMEFPTIPTNLSTKRHDTLYTVAAHNVEASTLGVPGAFCKVDASTGEILASFVSEPHETVGEPCLVPKIGTNREDDAFLLSYIVNGRDRTTDVVILDTQSMSVVSRASLPVYIPGGLHGRYVVDATYQFAGL